MMTAKMVVLIIMSIVLLVWIILIFFRLQIKMQQDTIARNLKAEVKCEKCGSTYIAGAKDYNDSYFVKSRSVTKTKIKGPATINDPNFSYYAKKVYCPYCKRREFGQILNISEIQNVNRAPMISIGIKYLIIMAIGGLIIIGVFRIPMAIIDRNNEKQIEQLKQQQYDDFKEKYGIEE